MQNIFNNSEYIVIVHCRVDGNTLFFVVIFFIMYYFFPFYCSNFRNLKYCALFKCIPLHSTLLFSVVSVPRVHGFRLRQALTLLHKDPLVQPRLPLRIDGLTVKYYGENGKTRIEKRKKWKLKSNSTKQ